MGSGKVVCGKPAIFSRAGGIKMLVVSQYIILVYYMKESLLFGSTYVHLEWILYFPASLAARYGHIYNSGQQDISPLCHTSAFFQSQHPCTLYLSIFIPSFLLVPTSKCYLPELGDRGHEGQNNKTEGFWPLHTNNHHINHGLLAQSFI